MVNAGMAALHLHDYLLSLAALVVEKVDVAVNTGVCSFLVIMGWLCVHQVNRPPLELVGADFFERLGTREVRGRADDFVGAEIVGEVISQAALDKIDGKIGDVDPDPATS